MTIWQNIFKRKPHVELSSQPATPHQSAENPFVFSKISKSNAIQLSVLSLVKRALFPYFHLFLLRKEALQYSPSVLHRSGSAERSAHALTLTYPIIKLSLLSVLFLPFAFGCVNSILVKWGSRSICSFVKLFCLIDLSFLDQLCWARIPCRVLHKDIN